MEAQPPEIEQHKTETKGLKTIKRRPRVSIIERDQGSPPKKSL